MKPEGTLPHSQVPATVYILSQLNPVHTTPPHPTSFFVSNQQSQYSVFHKLIYWHSQTFRLPNVMSLLQRDLLYRVTGLMRGLKRKFY
jgi:hypothetical protein